MNNPLSIMYHEHEVISNAGSVISEINNLWTNNPSKYTSIVNVLLNFFKEYADGFHHNKEEEILFPIIKNHPDFTLQEIIDEFENHHQDFRNYSVEIAECISENDFEKSYLILKTYFNELIDHIAAENEELFVMAENMLSDDELEKIYFKFQDIDIALGQDRKVKLENIINTIEI